MCGPKNKKQKVNVTLVHILFELVLATKERIHQKAGEELNIPERKIHWIPNLLLFGELELRNSLHDKTILELLKAIN